MPIPLATTLVTIKGRRPQSAVDPEAEGYDPPESAPDVIASDVAATITLPVGRRSNPTDEINRYTMRCDLLPEDVELTQHDTVLDQTTGVEYTVEVALRSWPEQFNLTHWKATLIKSDGLVGGDVVRESSRV